MILTCENMYPLEIWQLDASMNFLERLLPTNVFSNVLIFVRTFTVLLNWTVIGVKKDSCMLPRRLEPKSWFCCSPWWPLLVVLCILAFPYATDHSAFWCNIIHKIVVLIDWTTAINIFPYPIFFSQLRVPLWL